MREILFRGKCKKTGRWFTGQYIHLHKTTYCVKEDYEADKENNLMYIVFEEMTDWGLPNRHLRVDVIPETVGQYTGLTDKNGKNIFEGDIIKFCAGLKKPYIVEFDTGRFVLTRSDAHAEIIDVCIVPCEVIGNIHDNPELLRI